MLWRLFAGVNSTRDLVDFGSSSVRFIFVGGIHSSRDKADLAGFAEVGALAASSEEPSLLVVCGGATDLIREADAGALLFWILAKKVSVLLGGTTN